MLSLDNIIDGKANDIVAQTPPTKIKKTKTIIKVPWVDKYRPLSLDEIVYQTEVVKMLKQTLKQGSLPHLLFYGLPGTGKTSTILALARELFGPKIFHDRVLELNASDERGIGVVRKLIIGFAKKSVGNSDPRYPCPPYKMIVLDEADAMTMEAQSALRKVMESYSKITRFCFICNYINQIISPITSRCVKFRFKPLNVPSMFCKLQDISVKESVNITDKALKEIITVSRGDMRRAIMLLQNLKYLMHFKDKIVCKNVCAMANIIPEKILKQIWFDYIKKTVNACELKQIAELVTNLGYPISNTLEQLFTILINDKTIKNKKKANMVLLLSESEKKISEGSNEYLQLLRIFCHFHQEFRE
jgi:replication factor C subunit 2/4